MLLGEASDAADIGISDVPLLERFRDLQKLSKRDRDAVILLIDSVLARGEVEHTLKNAPDEDALGDFRPDPASS